MRESDPHAPPHAAQPHHLPTGTLFASQFLARRLALLARDRPTDATRDLARARALRVLLARAFHIVGPASSSRTLFDRLAAPLLARLGFRLSDQGSAPDGELFVARAHPPRGEPLAIVVAPWHREADGLWRGLVSEAIRVGARWGLLFVRQRLRLVDATRTYARRHLDFDLELAAQDEIGARFLAALLTAAAFAPPRSDPRAAYPIDALVSAAEQEGITIRSALERGVRDALTELANGLLASLRPRTRATLSASALFEQSLTVVYRLLFLLFAESRQLVPVWHALYRDSYTLAALGDALDRNRDSRGIWEALQAVSRLAHEGCAAGDLFVTPFNGALFSPATVPLFESARLPDGPVGRALQALTYGPAPERAGRERIAFRDLGVEQLGAVYERVLDFSPAIHRIAGAGSHRGEASLALLEGGGTRKATGSFYTPRAITDYLVRRTLRPLVQDASASDILELRVLDPAMGSGAFLVAACRYLAHAYEAALVREGACDPARLDDVERADFRRLVARRCLYGVDVNPTAVHLGRLSLWLATLAADRPLTFFDHHLRTGDSLLGASLADVARQPPGAAAPRLAPLPLFEDGAAAGVLSAIVPLRARLELLPDDTVDIVRTKERLIAELRQHEDLRRWSSLADLWCSIWFWPDDRAPDRHTFGAFADLVLRGRSTLPATLTDGWLQTSAEIARRYRFFHWTLEFPEVFYRPDGRPHPRPGFDAVVGNPPWDMLRADKTSTGDDARRVVRFAKGSGLYRCAGDGHLNRYQLFVDRALTLLREGGRAGLVLPSGLLSDSGSAALRRRLLHHCRIDAVVGFENRRGIFPIHRGVRFALVTLSAGGRTDELRCRFGERQVDILDSLPDAAGDARTSDFPVRMTTELIGRLSGSSLAIPDVRSTLDLSLVEGIASRCLPLGDARGWGASFGRELNATEDRRYLLPAAEGSHDGCLPVIEGKDIVPFVANVQNARSTIRREDASRALHGSRSFEKPRVAYRDIASAGNRLTLIAAVVPAGVVTTHTLFCLRTPLESHRLWALCGLMNSLVANYLVRLRLNTHVTTEIVHALPVPGLDRTSSVRRLARLARGLSVRPDDVGLDSRLQALVAQLYGLTRVELEHVLTTFPLISEAAKVRVLQRFDGLAARDTLPRSPSRPAIAR